MNYCVVVHAVGKELDSLRGEAYRVSRDARGDWYAERRKSGIARAKQILCNLRCRKRKVQHGKLEGRAFFFLLFFSARLPYPLERGMIHWIRCFDLPFRVA
jgi:hypothetical protein